MTSVVRLLNHARLRSLTGFRISADPLGGPDYILWHKGEWISKGNGAEMLKLYDYFTRQAIMRPEAHLLQFPARAAR